jgi:hypothetical protein
MVAGVVFAVAIGAGFAMPAHASRSLPALLIAAMYKHYAAAAFGEAISQRKEQGWVPDSWWRVVGLSLAVLLLMFGIGLVVLLIFPHLPVCPSGLHLCPLPT